MLTVWVQKIISLHKYTRFLSKSDTVIYFCQNYHHLWQVECHHIRLISLDRIEHLTCLFIEACYLIFRRWAVSWIYKTTFLKKHVRNVKLCSCYQHNISGIKVRSHTQPSMIRVSSIRYWPWQEELGLWPCTSCVVEKTFILHGCDFLL